MTDIGLGYRFKNYSKLILSSIKLVDNRCAPFVEICQTTNKAWETTKDDNEATNKGGKATIPISKRL